MFKSPKAIPLESGVVTSVDTYRAVCTVKVVSGRSYTGVRWLTAIGADDVSPHIGDSVYVSYQTGFPLILGKKPNASTSAVPNADLGVTGTALPRISSTDMWGVSNNPDQTSGVLQKDKLWRVGTSVFGLLRTGSIILKSHNLAQIILSKFDQSLRIVSRSYERFSDWGDEVVANFYGRVYRYVGFNRSLAASQNSIYEFEMIEGDVAAGEYAKTAPFTSANSAPAQAANPELRKKTLSDSSYNPIMVESLKGDGSLTLTITQSGGTQNSIVQQTNNLVSSTVQTTATSGESKVTQQDAQWEVYIQGVTIVVTPSSITSTVGGSTVTQTANSIVASIGATDLNLTGSQGVLSSNGHSVTVTSSGVALS